MDKYYSINKVSKMLGVTPQTLRNWDKSGKLKPSYTSNNGYRYYSLNILEKFTNSTNDEERITVGYCRVSSNKQKNDLERQVENVKKYLISKGEKFEIISDIGSGINYNKNGLKKLISLIASNKVKKIVVLYKDRLVRFGFELIKHIASIYNCEIEIIDNTVKTEEQELVEDLIQIITVFSCRLQGKRANKTKKMIKELIGDKND